MGNTCVNGGVVGDGLIDSFDFIMGIKVYKVFCCVDRGERIGEMSPVDGLKFPGNGIVPPEILKIDYWGVLKLTEKESVAVAELELEQKLPAAAGAWEEPIKDAKTKPSLIFYADDEIPERNEVRKPKISRGTMSFGLQVKSVLRTETGHLKQHFNLGKNLGHGQFGKTFLCVEKSTGKEYACKSIAKRKLLTQEDVDDVRREIEIMHHLSGNPNVISIKGAYEDSVAVHAVMELCTGGELFERIVKRGHYSEKKASELARTIVGVVETCHSLGVMHRDLKPENFLFVNEEEDSPIKAIDFGLSMYFKPGEVFSDIVGSPFYVAPEVLCQRYGPEADIWSAGVIIYIMLSGTPPFWGESEEEVFEDILHGDIDFTSDPWPIISESAKDLVTKMLERDPRKRLTAHQVLCHPWLQVEGEAPDKPLDSAILTRLTEFSAMEHIKKMALRVIAESLSEEEIAGLKEMFKMIDTDNSGYITFEELKDGLRQFGANSSESQILHLMKATDINNNGAIDCGEFLAATLHSNKIDTEDHLLRAFSYFDKDGSGYITQDELKKACEEFGTGVTHIKEMIQEADHNNDGQIDYSEFVRLMLKGNIS